MTTYEWISIVSMVAMAIIALAAIVMPIIVNACTNRAAKREKDFERQFDEHFKIINDISVAYAKWRANPSDCKNLIQAIYDKIFLVDYWVVDDLVKLAEAVLKYKPGDKIDEVYEECRRSIFRFLGIIEYASDEREPTAIKLRRVLREKQRKHKL